jgi:hypothetical protein
MEIRARYGSLVEKLPRMCEALGSISSTGKKTKKNGTRNTVSKPMEYSNSSSKEVYSNKYIYQKKKDVKEMSL